MRVRRKPWLDDVNGPAETCRSFDDHTDIQKREGIMAEMSKMENNYTMKDWRY